MYFNSYDLPKLVKALDGALKTGSSGTFLIGEHKGFRKMLVREASNIFILRKEWNPTIAKEFAAKIQKNSAIDINKDEWQ